jgi:hypothetical protein
MTPAHMMEVLRKQFTVIDLTETWEASGYVAPDGVDGNIGTLTVVGGGVWLNDDDLLAALYGQVVSHAEICRNGVIFDMRQPVVTPMRLYIADKPHVVDGKYPYARMSCGFGATAVG